MRDVQFFVKRTLNKSNIYFLLMNKENCRPLSCKAVRNNHEGGKAVQKTSQKQSQLSINARKEYHDHYMKYLIAANAQYFQSKVRITPKGRPKDIRFKIPCKTGMTIYKKDYNKKQAKYANEDGIKHNMSVDCIKTNNFLKDQPIDLRISDKTSYQKEFKYHPVRTEYTRRLKKRLDTTNADDNAPRFLETQNKTDFLNWAGKNYVPSMKPFQKSAVTNLPFEATTVYKTEFQSKNIAPTPIFVRGSSFPNFGCVSMLMKSNYSCEYSAKTCNDTEISCKPKHVDATLCKQFKGKTQYKREFIPSKKDENQFEERFKTLEDLQTLIIDL